MNDDDTLKQTVIIRRPARVTSDDRGNTVFTGKVENAELELMSSQALEEFLQRANDTELTWISEVADSKHDGVIERDCATGRFEVISDVELAAIMEADQQLLVDQRHGDKASVISKEDEEQALSLVSTQDLLKILGVDQHDALIDDIDVDDGFDPYDRD